MIATTISVTSGRKLNARVPKETSVGTRTDGMRRVFLGVYGSILMEPLSVTA